VGRPTLYAQAARTLPVAALDSAAAPAPPAEPADAVRLLVGRSTIVDFGKPIARVSLTSADVADALVTAPNELLVNGKAPGTISMFVWDRGGAIRRYDVIVQRDLGRLAAQLKELFPKESIDVRANGKTAVLSGTVSSKDVADKMASLAGSFVDTKDELISLLQVGEGGRSNQVLLHVRFAEVSRSALTDAGVSLFTGANGYKDYLARSTTDQTQAPVFDNSDPAHEKLTFSDFLNLFLFNSKEQLGAVIKALQTRGLFQSLAEPNLVAESGKEASFLAGGEFPIPIAQPSSGGTSVTVVFKEFGVRLTFTPTVIGNRVNLKVRPEVSTLDFTNAVTLNGFRIPALSTRRTETELELNDGQTFAIAGLMNNTVNSTMQKIPGIGDIPILGLLFKSKAAQKNHTELVVMITPEILANNSPGVTPNLPRLPESYLPALPEKKSIEAPPAAFPPSASAAPPAPAAAALAAPNASPATKAASVLKAESGSTRTVVHAPDPQPATAGAAKGAPAGAQTTVGTGTPAAGAATATDRKAAERATKDDRKREEADARAQADEARRLAKQADIDRKKQKEEDERQAKLAREQAQRDGVAARRAAEQAKKQAEIDKQHQKEVAEAEGRLRAAQAAYQAELERAQQK
jgi:pilus assembly protein CpaC